MSWNLNLTTQNCRLTIKSHQSTIEKTVTNLKQVQTRPMIRSWGCKVLVVKKKTYNQIIDNKYLKYWEEPPGLSRYQDSVKLDTLSYNLVQPVGTVQVSPPSFSLPFWEGVQIINRISFLWFKYELFSFFAYLMMQSI